MLFYQSCPCQSLFVSASHLLTPCLSLAGPRHTMMSHSEVVALAREVLGGNGVVTDFHVAKQFCDMEAIYTYEVRLCCCVGWGGGGR
jgi:hypothetical protein